MNSPWAQDARPPGFVPGGRRTLPQKNLPHPQNPPLFFAYLDREDSRLEQILKTRAGQLDVAVFRGECCWYGWPVRNAFRTKGKERDLYRNTGSGSANHGRDLPAMECPRLCQLRTMLWASLQFWRVLPRPCHARHWLSKNQLCRTTRRTSGRNREPNGARNVPC